jgi:hypothetical protein
VAEANLRMPIAAQWVSRFFINYRPKCENAGQASAKATISEPIMRR